MKLRAENSAVGYPDGEGPSGTDGSEVGGRTIIRGRFSALRIRIPPEEGTANGSTIVQSVKDGYSFVVDVDFEVLLRYDFARTAGAFTLSVVAMAERETVWHPYEAGRLQYRVQNRFGEEPQTMPNNRAFGRVSATFAPGAAECSIIRTGCASTGENNVWVTDNADHQVMKFSREGKLLMTLGVKEKAGADSRTFNRPTDIAFGANGDFYVSDGYGNSRVVKFSKDGKYLLDWGRKGSAPGEFDLPHSVQTDSKGLVYVSDRENNRSQSIFITPQDDMSVLTHRDNEENLAYDSSQAEFSIWNSRLVTSWAPSGVQVTG